MPADETGELKKHCRHKLKYRRHKGRKLEPSGRTIIPNRVSIHQRPLEAETAHASGTGKYLPKDTDFHEVEQAELDKIQAKINRRPHEKSGFSSPRIEVFKLLT